MQEKKVVNLFWTGGWDSTFRLLTLITNEQVLINLYYVIDKKRKSLNNELQTMDEILSIIHRRIAGSKDRVLSITHFDSDQIIDDEDISSKYKQLKSIAPLGTQYPVLAKFALMHGLNDVELSIAMTDTWTSRHLRDACIRVDDPIIGEYRVLKPDTDSDAPISLFRYFTFPTLHISKEDMMRVSRENDMLDILDKSWFCHTPYNGKPCGVCSPCLLAVDEGMNFRLPLIARIRSKAPRLSKVIMKLINAGFLGSIKLATNKMVRE